LCENKSVPRVVDHSERRFELAQALWRVVRRDGVHHVSVRSVAAEAGISPSALRHYFATQDELMGFALRSMVERVTARLQPVLSSLHGRDGAARILGELLPLDAERRAEVEVYLAFIGRAHADPTLRAIHDEAEQTSGEAVRFAIGLIAEAKLLGPGRTVAAEAQRLYPLIDGLALHGALWPRRHPASLLRRVLEAHLDELSTPMPSPT
jgi:DNA-binding transcriptional regulator YbjK